MSRFVLIVLLGLIAISTAQWNNNQNYPQFPNQQPFPGQPFPVQPNINDLCRQPGANCKTESRFAEESSVTDHKGQSTKFTRVCDDRGCYDRKISSGSSTFTVNFIVMIICAMFTGAKLIFNH